MSHTEAFIENPESAIIDLTLAQKSAVVTLGGAATATGMAKYRMLITKWLKRSVRIIMSSLTNPETWKKPSSWIYLTIFLRLAYVFMNHNGLNPFKKNIEGHHVFLTGAGGGLGKLLALRMGKLGAKLSLSDISLEHVNKARDFIVNEGIPAENVHTFVCDCSSLESVKAAANEARRVFGDVHILVNNAGIVTGKKLQNASVAEINRTFKVNTTSHLWTIREFLPAMKANKKGHIVTIASMAGIVGVAGMTDYSASKFGAVAIDEAVRLELRKSGDHAYVKTTCICPYFINTGMFEGAKKAFPMYILDQDYVADRIMWGFRQEEALVMIPWRGNVIHLMRLLPTSIGDWLA
jgi:all-trans-retinol dehydrogenase (NAD+)